MSSSEVITISKEAVRSFANIQTPFYYYDMDLLRSTVAECRAQAARHGIEVHYAVKANDQRPIVGQMLSAGFGVDCVSGPEVEYALKLGFTPEKIVFAGVGKTDAEIILALKGGIGCFNCESIPEIEVINALAGQLGVRARIAVRVNPDIDARTHRYISTGQEENKFGIAPGDFPELFGILRSAINLDFCGIHLHVGSQITDMSVFEAECRKAASLSEVFADNGFPVANINLGGGLGVDYANPAANPVPDFASWMETIRRVLPAKEGQRVHIEPGRALVAQCGSLISRVVFVKKVASQKCVILDAGMNDLIRPALYQAHHKIENLTGSGPLLRYDVVGPVCESSDFWGGKQLLPETSRGDLVAIRSAGAYGQVMAMRYNRRPFAEAYYSDQL